MLKQLFYKWFGLSLVPACSTCDVLRDQLEQSNMERRELLQRLLTQEKSEPAPSPLVTEELQPIGNKHIPWRVRQEMLEREDRRANQLKVAAQKTAEEARIAALEKELDIPEGA